MENKTFSRELELRTKRFAISIIKLSASLPQTVEGKVIRNQIARSGTSIGANYREANRSGIKSDFINKISICESESTKHVIVWILLMICNGWREVELNLYWMNQTNYLRSLHLWARN